MLSHTFLATQLRTATDFIKRALAAIEADQLGRPASLPGSCQCNDPTVICPVHPRGPTVAELLAPAPPFRFRDAFDGAEDGQRIPQRCTRPPAGWTCSRAEGHEGPCAALPVPPKSLAEVQLEQLFGRVVALEQIVLAISEDACSKHGLYPF